jgi:ABC-type multidrug transport system fused ATPase/permease subunit
VQIVTGGFFMDGTVSYAPQQPWIINDTIKSNILFCNAFDATWYRKVVSACALDHDIKTMPNGEETEIVSFY